ncbi:hypothetical protein SAMN05421548_10778 [Paraburkholderia lycopersici]|uniref:Hemophore-related protein n=1 Tax=Paraburkholderia lycopersici TaxID=416944 RepID=A0A1G6LZ30_9BURK|nr:hypothetical protein SAMN05421548_10778 [Paraburkholderia lycopersici]
MKGRTNVERLARVVAAFVLYSLAPNANAEGEITCPPMPPPADSIGHNVQTAISAKAGTLGKISAAQIEVKTETTAQSLFDKFPHADRLTALQILSSTYCSILKDQAISPSERANRWERFQEKTLELMTKG